MSQYGILGDCGRVEPRERMIRIVSVEGKKARRRKDGDRERKGRAEDTRTREIDNEQKKGRRKTSSQKWMKTALESPSRK